MGPGVFFKAGSMKMFRTTLESTVKPVLSGHLKIDKTKVLMENGSLIKFHSIAECAPLGAFCNTFDLHQVIIGIENQFLVFFFSGSLRQVLLYDIISMHKGWYVSIIKGVTLNACTPSLLATATMRVVLPQPTGPAINMAGGTVLRLLQLCL